jgi:hypothetical protein
MHSVVTKGAHGSAAREDELQKEQVCGDGRSATQAVEAKHSPRVTDTMPGDDPGGPTVHRHLACRVKPWEFRCCTSSPPKWRNSRPRSKRIFAATGTSPFRHVASLSICGVPAPKAREQEKELTGLSPARAPCSGSDRTERSTKPDSIARRVRHARRRSRRDSLCGHESIGNAHHPRAPHAH